MSKPVIDWLVEKWTTRFSEITLTMGDLQLQLKVSPIEDSAVRNDILWWEQPFSCAPDSPLWTGAPEETWMEVGRIILSAAGVDPAPTPEIQSTYLEIVRQAMGGLGQDLGERLASDVSAPSGSETPPRRGSRHCFQIKTEVPGKTVDFQLVISDSLAQFISAAEAAAAADASRNDSGHEDQPEQEMEPPPPLGSRTFELLLDVELPVSVSFGRAALKLNEAIKLITGSLIELDRGISDPVELLVNNCVIARGEVVVVDGNYGVRITEIVSQKERLQHTRRYMLQ